MGNRINYAIQQVGVRTELATNSGLAFTAIHGVQSVGVNGQFGQNAINTLGEFPIYLSTEDSQEVTLTVRRVLDGYPLLYTLSTSDTLLPIITECAQLPCAFALAIFDDSKSAAKGTPINILQCTGMYMTSFEYTFDANGYFNESISYVGHNKGWQKDSRIVNAVDKAYIAGLLFDGQFSSVNSPYNGWVARRQHWINGGTAPTKTILPLSIPGMLPNGIPGPTLHINKIVVRGNINQEIISSYGSKLPYCRKPQLPIQINTDITVNSVSGDNMSMTELGVYTPALCQYRGNTRGELINIYVCNEFVLALGSLNKLVGVNQEGGGTDGGIVQNTYSYTTFNQFQIFEA